MSTPMRLMLSYVQAGVVWPKTCLRQAWLQGQAWIWAGMSLTCLR